MGKILSYSNLNGAPAGGDVMFIGDISVSAPNPEIKYVCTDDLFKRSSIAAANSSGLNVTDDSGNSSIFVADGGNVGIGSTGPQYPLHVCRATGNVYNYNQAVSANSSVGIVTKNDAQGWTFGTTSTDTFSVSKGVADFTTAKYLEIDTSGNIDIGTTAFSAKLNVADDILVNSTNDLYLDAANNEIRLSGGTLKINEYGGGTSGSPQTNDVQIYGQGSNSPLFFADSSSLRVGINTNSPSNALHVVSSNSAVLKGQTSANSGYIEISNSINSAYFGNSSSGIFLGSTNSVNANNINISSNANTHIGGTDTTYKFQATSSNYLLGRFNSTASAGSAFSILSDQENPTNIALSFSRTVSSTARVNWLAGTFYSSGSYFGIHNKDVSLSEANATFDTSVLTNNLFYINTSGDQYLGKSIHTHNKTNTGHNTGRFVQSYSVRAYLDADNQVVLGAFGNNLNNTSMIPISGTYVSQIYMPAPFSGKLINTQFYGSDTLGGPYGRHLISYFNKTTPGAAAPPSTLSSSNSVILKNTSFIGIDTLTTTSVITKGVSDYDETSNSLTFAQNDMLAFAVKGSGGGDDGYVTITLTYEFDIV